MSDIDDMLWDSPSSSPRAAGARPLVLGLAGPCGAGKTTLAAAFSRLPGVGVAGEPILSDLIETRPTSGTGALLQERILHGRAEAAASVREPIVILDRTVAEDREVFFPLHRRLGSLSENHEQRLSGVAEAMEIAIGVPVAMVILTASLETLRRRARDDGRPGWLVESLPLQLELYEGWLRTLQVPFVPVNTNNIPLDEFPSVAEWIVASVPGVLTGTDVDLPRLGLQWQRR